MSYTSVNDLIRVVPLTTLITSGSLTHLIDCSIASYYGNQVCYLQKRVMLTEAAGDVELVVWNDREFSHFAGAAIEKYITEFSPISSRGISVWLG